MIKDEFPGSAWIWTEDGWRPRSQLPSDIEGAKPGDVLTQDGWTPKIAFRTRYGIVEPRYSVEVNGKTPLHAKIMSIGATRIQILEDKAEEAKMWPGVEYPKILTAIKEIKILLDLIREAKI